MRLILHIGTEKTGTTSFQNWLARHKSDLAEQGIYHPAFLGPTSHYNIAFQAIEFSENNVSLRRKGLLTEQQHDALANQIKKRLVEDLSLHDRCHTCIISNEHLHSNLDSASCVDRLASWLRSLFSTVDVVIHLRPQIDAAVSAASSAARGTAVVNRSLFRTPDPNTHYYNYNSLVSLWEAPFGAEHVILVPYKSSPSMFSLACKLLPIDTANLPEPERHNEALDWRVIAILNAAKRHNPDSLGVIPRNIIDALPCDEKVNVDIETAMKFQAAFVPGNEELISRRPDLNPGDLTPDWSRYSSTSNIDQLIRENLPAEQLASLIRRYNWELNSVKCELEAERAISSKLRGNRTQCAIYVRRARDCLKQLSVENYDPERIKAIEIVISRCANDLSLPDDLLLE